MISGIKYLVTLTDFISEKPQVLLNNSSRSKTIYGGILSLISVVLISVALIKFGYDMVTRANSTLTYNQTPVNNSSFNYGEFPFMVALLDNGLKLIDNEDRYYYFLADVWNFSPDNSTGQIVMNLNRQRIQTEKCNIEKHFGAYRDYFKDVPYLNHHFCAVPGQNITLFGIYGSIQPYNFLDFWISTCVNDTSVNRTNCFSREQSQARLVNTYISYQYLDYFIDHSNIGNPGQLILKSEILPVSSTIYKRDFFYIRNIQYDTDLDYIFSSETKQSYQKVSAFRETSDLRPQGTVPGSFALISIMMDSYVDQYSRRFTKFQEVLANIGGLFKGICIIAYILNYIFFDEIYYLNLISGIFKTQPEAAKLSIKENFNKVEIQNKSETNLGKHKNSNVVNSKVVFFEKNKDLFPSATQSNNIILNFNSQNVSQTLNKKKREIPLKQNTIMLNKSNSKKMEAQTRDLQLTFFEMLFARCRSSTGKYKTYNLAKEYTQKHLCVKNILYKLSEVNKLKCFVFNEEQIQIFNSVQTPSYTNLETNTQDIWEDMVIANKTVIKDVLVQNFRLKEVHSEMDQNFLNILKSFE